MVAILREEVFLFTEEVTNFTDQQTQQHRSASDLNLKSSLIDINLLLKSGACQRFIIIYSALS